MITHFLIFSMERFKRFNTRVCEVIKGDLVNILMVTGILVGFIVGIAMMQVRKTPYSSREMMYVSFLGELFLRMLKGLAMILVTSCLITAIGSLDIRLSKRIGIQFIVYLILTKLLSTLLGIILALALRPGVFGASEDEDGDTRIQLQKKYITAADTFMDMGRNMFPSNVVLMFLGSYETLLIKPENDSENLEEWELDENGTRNSAANMLGIVCCSIIFGIALSVMAAEAKPLLDLFRCITQVFMKLTVWVLWISPVLVIFLIAGQLLKSKGFITLLSKVGMYIVCMLIGYSLLLFGIMPLYYFVLVWKNPYRLLRSVVGSLMTGFATQSSLAAMPMAMKELEKAGYEKRIVEIVVPVGINLNKDGSAIFQGTAAVFFAQFYGQTLSFSNLISILFLGTAASMATAGVPFGAAIMLIMILDGLSIPYYDISLIIAVDWFIDRGGTLVSVWGNCVLSAILADLNQHLLSGPDEEEK